MILDFGNMLASYTSNVLYLDNIIKGYAVENLKELGYLTPGVNNYKEWINTQHG
jgi:hypothetical protein